MIRQFKISCEPSFSEDRYTAEGLMAGEDIQHADSGIYVTVTEIGSGKSGSEWIDHVDTCDNEITGVDFENEDGQELEGLDEDEWGEIKEYIVCSMLNDIDCDAATRKAFAEFGGTQINFCNLWDSAGGGLADEVLKRIDGKIISVEL